MARYSNRSHSPDAPVLTLASVREMRRACEALESKILDLQGELKEKHADVEAAMRFLSAAQREAVMSDEPQPASAAEIVKPPKASKPSKKKKRVARKKDYTWTAAILEALVGKNEGLTHQETMAALPAGFAALASANSKPYYNAAGKLLKSKQIVRHGLRYYRWDAFSKLQQAGTVPVLKAGDIRPRQNSTASLTLSVLRKHPDGLTGPELKAKLGAMPGTPESITKHGQYIYNVLSTLMGGGLVGKSKEGERYVALKQ